MERFNPIVEIYCGGKEPALPGLRQRIRKAMADKSHLPNWSEYYPGIGKLPAHIKADEFPVLLINHRRVVYDFDNDLEVNDLDLGLHMRPKKSWLRRMKIRQLLSTNFSFFSAVVIAFFPKCPFCWAAYMSLFSYFGLSKLSYHPWLLPLFIGLFFVNLFSMYANGKRHGYKPLILSLLGGMLIVVNRIFLEVQGLMIVGASLLIVASLWNSLPKRMINSIRSYVSFN